MRPMDRPLIVSSLDSTLAARTARAVAEVAGRPFVDGFHALAGQAGCGQLGASPTGERLLERVAQHPAAVFAVPAEAFVERELRCHLLDACVVVHLSSSAAVASAALEALEEWRFVESHGVVPVDPSAERDAVSAVLALWRRGPIAVAAAARSYVVDVGAELVEAPLLGLARAASSIVCFSDDNVEPLHTRELARWFAQAGPKVHQLVMPAGEEHKNLETMGRLWQSLLAWGVDRRCLVVAQGGGVVTDVGGFLASGWMRGVSWVSLPTTLLGMVDASVGGKTGVDLGGAKNAVGAFWQPSAVQCATRVLATEPVRGYRAALAEVIKTALIGDADLLHLLEREASGVLERDSSLVAEVVRRSIRVKARVVSLDEREGGVRATLNLGHTIGHALESAGGFSRWSHGEAISLGLVAALRLGVRLGVTPPALEARIRGLLGSFELPVRLEAEDLARAAELLGHDKKRSGREIRFVFARAAGEVAVQPVSLGELTSLAASLADPS